MLQDVAPSAPTPPHGALFYVAAVNIVIWLGLFGYLIYLDLKLRASARTGQESPR